MFKHSVKLRPFKVPLSSYAPPSNTLKVTPVLLNYLSIASEEYLSISRIYISMISITQRTKQAPIKIPST